MKALTFKEYEHVYKDKQGEENFSVYGQKIESAAALIPFTEGMSTITVAGIEAELSLNEFAKHQKRGNLESISQVLFRFSEFSVYDPAYSELKQVELAFVSNEDLYHRFKLKMSKIIGYIENHPLRKKVSEKLIIETRNAIINGYFDTEKKVSVCKKILEIPDSSFFQKIDKFFSEEAK